MSDPNVTPPVDTPPTAIAPPAAPSATEPMRDAVLHDAFTLGWEIVELRSRIQVALSHPTYPGLRLSSVWRAIFNRIATLQKKAFPASTTAQTLYEPPPPDKLPYLYPPEPDYANLGIGDKDASGTIILGDFKLYEVTRRAINCLSLLHVKEEESLIPDRLKEYQDHLVKAILEAAQDPGGGGGDTQPPSETTQPQDALQKAKQALTERTIKFLDAWDCYLRENYYLGGMRPEDDLELIAYEAGHSMSSLSWGISAATAPMEEQLQNGDSQTTTQTGGEQQTELEQKFIDAWKNVFRAQDVIRLQHQISALSSALDDAYYLQHPEQKRPADNAVLVDFNPYLPSQTIQAIKHSIDYWQRAVDWIPENLNEIRDDEDKVNAGWSKPMRLALTEQANIWQTLMTGQQSLRAYSMESATQKIMEDVMGDIQNSVRKDFGSSVREAEKAFNEIAQEVKAAISSASTVAVSGLEALYQSCKRFLWPIIAVVGVIAVIGIVLLIWALSKNEPVAGVSGAATGFTGIISAILGYFGMKNLASAKAAQQTAIESKSDTAKTTVDSKATAGATEGASADDSNLLTRIGGAAQETGKMVLDALERGYEQARIELDGLNRSVAVTYPLVEFFVLTFKLESDTAFLTKIIWNKTEREEEIKRVVRAAFGPLAIFTTPSASDSNGDGSA